MDRQCRNAAALVAHSRVCNPHLHFHCVVIDGVFDSATSGAVIFHAATGLDAHAIAQVQAQVRRRLLRVFVRRGLLPQRLASRAERHAIAACLFLETVDHKVGKSVQWQ